MTDYPDRLRNRQRQLESELAEATGITAPPMRMKCDCGSYTFWLASPELTAVCTGCGERTPLGVTAFKIRGVSP
jgi:hypothetical protein